MPDSKNNAPNLEVIQALKKAEKMRIEFVANVSHELRTPLTAIKGYAETLLQDLESGRNIDPRFIRVILRNSDRLLALTQDLLDLSAIETGADELHVAPISTEELTKLTLDHLSPTIEGKNIRISTSFQAKTLNGDPKRVEQVLTNLTENALKYCPENSEIKIEWKKESAADSTGVMRDWITLLVSDNGPGIAEKHLERVFERFYRIDKSRARESGGTGLGLAIVKHIMQRHEGTVHAESELGKGTRMICRFPA